MLALVDLRLSCSQPLCGDCGKPALAGRSAASRDIVVVGLYGSVVINHPTIHCCGKRQAVHPLEFGTMPNTPFAHANVFYQACCGPAPSLRPSPPAGSRGFTALAGVPFRPRAPRRLRRRSCCNWWAPPCCTRTPRLTP